MTIAENSWFGRHRRFVVILAITVILVAAGIICFMPGLVAPWSRLNNEEQEIDLYSGRARVRRYFLYYQVRQDLRETPLSQAIASDGPSGTSEQWVKVNIFQPGVRHSPHFIYHGAFAQANQLAILWVLYKCDPKARAKTSRQLLLVWRESGSYLAGDDYLRHLREALPDEEDGGQVISADKIPDDIAEQTLAERASDK